MRWLSRRFAWKEVCGVEPSEACCAENLCVGILGYVDLNNDLTKRPSSIQKGVRAGCSFAPAASDQRWSRILLNKLLSNITYILIHTYFSEYTTLISAYIELLLLRLFIITLHKYKYFDWITTMLTFTRALLLYISLNIYVNIIYRSLYSPQLSTAKRMNFATSKKDNVIYLPRPPPISTPGSCRVMHDAAHVWNYYLFYIFLVSPPTK